MGRELRSKVKQSESPFKAQTLKRTLTEQLADSIEETRPPGGELRRLGLSRIEEIEW